MRFAVRHVLAALCACAAFALGGSASAQEEREFRLADAPPGSVRLFVSGGMLAPVLAVKAEIEKATGRTLAVQASESRTLQREIEAGQPFEAALITTVVVNDMIAKGKMVAGSDVHISVVRVGVSVRGDAPKLDVTTPEGLKNALLGAHSIRRFYGVAASTPIVDNLFAKLEVTEAIKDRMVTLGSGAPPPEPPLPRGQYELIVNLVSAILPMNGWKYLGLIPEQYQAPVAHSAALGSAGDQALGKKVIAVLETPQFEAALKANGSSRK
jgi:molybdate transport system substrate-binding protein